MKKNQYPEEKKILEKCIKGCEITYYSSLLYKYANEKKGVSKNEKNSKNFL